MQQIRSRKAIQEEGAQAAREGKAMDVCRYDEGTEARDKWEKGYCQVAANAVHQSNMKALRAGNMLYSRALQAMHASRAGVPA
ncbi:hypothetical protein LJR296_001423 [Cupriavidus necator]|uniref:hypothetical protein n=1 Tax=Cupriavidus necator TaxID=106590 RepID=UPI003ECCC3A9